MSIDFDWTSVVSTAAVISTVLQYLTGLFICKNYVLNKSTGDSSGLPLITGFLSCALWLKYGSLTQEKTVILVNTIGTILMLSYTIIYFLFTINKRLIIKQFTGALLVLITALLYENYEDDRTKVIQLIGILSCSITLFFIASPLSMLFHVIRVKNTECLPFPIILSSFFVSLLWYFYGVLIKDGFLQFPNLVGCILASLQLMLFVKYPSRSGGKGPGYQQLDSVPIF